MDAPDRWLHLRHPDGFSDELFASFAAHCRLWRAYTEAVIADWSALNPSYAGPPPRYVFFEPVRGEAGVVTLPIGGDYTVGSRALFEDYGSHLLSDFFPLEFKLRLEVGLTEPRSGRPTSWRPVLKMEP
ncbi:MAG: hypothetical protein R3A79_25180 [Nannocystaceae bacterium]